MKPTQPMKYMFLPVLFLLWSSEAIAVAPPVGTITDAAPSPALYRHLVDMARSGKTNIDYAALRFSLATLPAFDPHDTDVRQALLDAADASDKGDCKAVMEKTATVLQSDFAITSAHLMRAECFEKMGDAQNAAQERDIGRGLGTSILKSGDGDSVETAYVVVTQDEENFVMAVRGLHETRQSLVMKNGHQYDLLHGTDEQNQKTADVYFQVDAIFSGETNMLNPTR